MDQPQLIALMNEDLATEYRSIVQYTQHIATLKGLEVQSLLGELRQHVVQELNHALVLAEQIDFLGGVPTTEVPAVPSVTDTQGALELDLQLEELQLDRYRTGSPRHRSSASGRGRGSQAPPRANPGARSRPAVGAGALKRRPRCHHGAERQWRVAGRSVGGGVGARRAAVDASGSAGCQSAAPGWGSGLERPHQEKSVTDLSPTTTARRADARRSW